MSILCSGFGSDVSKNLVVYFKKVDSRFNKIPKAISQKLLFVILILGISTGISILPTPLLAQFADVRQHLKSLPTSRVNFAPGTVGTTITNATDHVYLLRAHSEQKFSLKANRPLAEIFLNKQEC